MSADILDDKPNMLTFPTGNQAPITMLVFGYLLTLIGLGLLVASSFIWGFLTLFLGLRICATYNGIQIDVAKKRYREYSAYLFVIKRGKWLELDNYPFLSILGTNAGFSVRGIAAPRLTQVERVFDICLLNQNHRAKKYVVRVKNYLEASEEADRLADLLNKKVVIYSPEISAASIANKNKGRRR